MTDLIDKWEKGELPEAWYYVKDIHNRESLDRYFKETDNFEYLEDWEVGEVLAEVPSYEEFLSLTYAKEEDEKIIAEYEQENNKLKKLLKECRDLMVVRDDVDTNLPTIITQVLGEDK